MDEQWGPQISAVAADLQEAARVTLGDVHLDAKLYPQWHPYGSGSLRATDDNVKHAGIFTAALDVIATRLSPFSCLVIPIVGPSYQERSVLQAPKKKAKDEPNGISCRF